MSRIGKQPIPVPSGVEVAINGTEVTVKGPKGTLTQTFDKDMIIELEDGAIVVKRPSDERRHRSLHGLTRTLIANMVKGVSEGFQKELEIVGVGYRAALKGSDLDLSLGFSHPVIVTPEEGITFEVPAPTKIVVKGIDKQRVGQVAAEIRKIRPPEPYKGKGVRYAGEQVRRKLGKAAK
ncbi:50S ribosomal protein L6 [Coriobacteriia bacterium Es71-Z0120]|uniref:50S ribosomal protein L6 n=1 Tax=Parvivirga hydrogeniphila TaxID=2939460 RepID=UPI002260D6D6|nr:50S ribosomal protein L6 [Parvivirga hydrogeniphila]MCL4078550.1 50S ribosomal protein L6 [Parvivirga hydrogeniphila]